MHTTSTSRHGAVLKMFFTENFIIDNTISAARQGRISQRVGIPPRNAARWRNRSTRQLSAYIIIALMISFSNVAYGGCFHGGSPSWFFYITARNSNKNLSETLANRVVMKDPDPMQFWDVGFVEGKVIIKSHSYGGYLTYKQDNTEPKNGSDAMRLYDNKDTYKHGWYLEDQGDGYCKLKSAKHSDMYLDIKNGSGENGAQVHISNKAGEVQAWRFEYVSHPTRVKEQKYSNIVPLLPESILFDNRKKSFEEYLYNCFTRVDIDPLAVENNQAGCLIKYRDEIAEHVKRRKPAKCSVSWKDSTQINKVDCPSIGSFITNEVAQKMGITSDQLWLAENTRKIRNDEWNYGVISNGGIVSVDGEFKNIIDGWDICTFEIFATYRESCSVCYFELLDSDTIFVGLRADFRDAIRVQIRNISLVKSDVPKEKIRELGCDLNYVWRHINPPSLQCDLTGFTFRNRRYCTDGSYGGDRMYGCYGSLVDDSGKKDIDQRCNCCPRDPPY